MTPADCPNPQPIHVSHGSERHEVICSTCLFRGPIVADRKSARQHFDAVHAADSPYGAQR